MIWEYPYSRKAPYSEAPGFWGDPFKPGKRLNLLATEARWNQGAVPRGRRHEDGQAPGRRRDFGGTGLGTLDCKVMGMATGILLYRNKSSLFW